jgi:phage shock protein E
MFRKFLKKAFGPGTDFKALVQKGAVIVDVRTAHEFKEGHIENSVNIPLDGVNAQSNGLLRAGKPVITVCRSGVRSGMAVRMMRQSGIEAYNGGAWNVLAAKLK